MKSYGRRHGNHKFFLIVISILRQCHYNVWEKRLRLKIIKICVIGAYAQTTLEQYRIVRVFAARIKLLNLLTY